MHFTSLNIFLVTQGNDALDPCQGLCPWTHQGPSWVLALRAQCFSLQAFPKRWNSRAAKTIHCAQNVKTVRLCTEFHKSKSNIFLICHILWHFQDGRHWPWEFYMGQKLKHSPIFLKIVSNCLSCPNDSKNV